jgi:hypothetical protein
MSKRDFLDERDSLVLTTANGGNGFCETLRPMEEETATRLEEELDKGFDNFEIGLFLLPRETLPCDCDEEPTGVYSPEEDDALGEGFSFCSRPPNSFYGSGDRWRRPNIINPTLPYEQ